MEEMGEAAVVEKPTWEEDQTFRNPGGGDSMDERWAFAMGSMERGMGGCIGIDRRGSGLEWKPC